MIHLIDFNFVLPLVFIAIGSVITIIIEIIFRKSQNVVYYFSIACVIAAIAASFLKLDVEQFIFNEFLKVNNSSYVFCVLVLISVLLTLLSSKSYIEKYEINFSEFYSVILFSATGMLTMIFANDLLIIFLGLETMSICFYILAGFMRKRPKSNESSMKYFLLGAFMTGFLLYGISLIYGFTGYTNISKIFLNVQNFESPVFIVGLGLILIGFFFKIGIFPFQMWIPDVYEGSPTTISGLLSTSGKIAALGTIAPIILLQPSFSKFQFIFSILALLTMLFGNVIAIAQTNIKRLLAFSSIASAGYLMVGLAAVNELALKGIMFYLLSYVFMQLGAFILVSVIEKFNSDNRDFSMVNIADYKGLAKKNPFLAAMLTVFLFSLAGIPPFAGFWGKYYLFYAAIKSNLIWLSVLAILFSLISVYYYLRVVVYMWFTDSETTFEENNPVTAWGSRLSIIISFAGTIVFGLLPQLFFTLFKLK
ncbi:MAG TPA: NADH-quinone oxidoreductase subunit N [Ignavibacteria bacterium]